MTTILDLPVDLRPGQEWYSEPFELHPGRSVHLHAVGTVRFYTQLVNTARFDELNDSGQAGPESSRPWPFAFGSDSSTHDESTPVVIGGQFRIVLRLGVFNNAGRVRVRVSEE